MKMYSRALLLVLGFSALLLVNSQYTLDQEEVYKSVRESIKKADQIANEIYAEEHAKETEPTQASNEINIYEEDEDEEEFDWPSFLEPTTETPSIDEKPDLCKDSKFDAITRVNDGQTYLFKGKYYWEIKCYGIVAGYPKLISDDWKGLPDNIDAAVTIDDFATYFFKGDKYWKFLDQRPYPGYPKLISIGFRGAPNSPDAVFQWVVNGKLYFFKGSQYWRFDPNFEPPVTDNYPREISLWKGLPSSIDASFKWFNDKTYFFKDQRYYRFDDVKEEVDKTEKYGQPKFPRSTAYWWFSCPGANNGTVMEPFQRFYRSQDFPVFRMGRYGK